MRIRIILLLAFSFYLFATSNTYTQTLGFGCLGLSGVYGGITQFNYKADGLNESLMVLTQGTTSTDDDLKFEKATGYRIGANIFRAKFKKLFFSAKGFFQFLKEEHSYKQYSSSGVLTNTYRLSLNHWGVGIDIGVPLSTLFDLKLLEGGVMFFNPDFVNEVSLDGTIQHDSKIEPDQSKIGYYVGGGLIIHLVPDYISVEGTAAYSFFKINKMGNDSNYIIPISQISQNFIEQGGFIAVLQLNIGFPL